MKEVPAYAVLNCHVSQVLGLYGTAEEANAAAAEFGRYSFAHHLSAGRTIRPCCPAWRGRRPTAGGRDLVMSSTPVVTVDSKPACVQCHATYRALESAGVSYVVVDVTQAPAALEYIMDDLGYSQAPVVVATGDEENQWSGFRPDLIGALAGALQNTANNV